MNWFITLYTALLFFLLSPTVFLKLPANGSTKKVAAVHAVIFALIWQFTHKMVWRMSVSM
jgi:hypothetical protein